MRVTAHVFLGYGLVLVLGSIWRLLPIDFAAPDVIALVAVYLGLTARPVNVGPMLLRIAPPTLGAVILGYLGDLLAGSPRGLIAFTAGMVCVVGHLVHSALIVRGRMVTIIFSTVTGATAGLVMLIVRASSGLVPGSLGGEMKTLLASALLTGLAGPLVFRLCRSVDARFARSPRERNAALGGTLS